MRLVVTTWNLQGYAGVDHEAVAGHLRGAASDVVFLQEVQRQQARRLARALSARTLAWRFKHRTLPHPAEGMAIVGVTRPVESAGAIALTARWRPWSWRRRIFQLAELGDLTLANVHLTPHGDAAARAREVAKILHRLPKGDEGRLVAGDFNALPDATLLVELAAADLRDAWTGAPVVDDEVGPTNWSSSRRAGPPDQRLDYVWVSPEVSVTGVRVPRFGDSGFEGYPLLSDHLPLTVDLEI
ncbi:MAG: endonuclease/exonuclease/phosphatase family protein [Acidimicrobiales bacterium]